MIQGNSESSLPIASHVNGMLFLFQYFKLNLFMQRMMKLILYSIILAAFIPLAASARDKNPARRHISRRVEIIRNSILNPEESGDSLQTARIRPAFQDTVQAGRRKRIKEVPQSKPQPKPERVTNRPPPDPADDNRRPAGQRPPAERPAGGVIGGGGMRPGAGGDINRGGGQSGQGGQGGGGRQQPPPPTRGR